jgi:2-polyprenyl-3-methyl-5-hydroxy-6-metoxy-1,4-benzoquinol methylase
MLNESAKYYNYKDKRLLTFDIDGCDFSEWNQYYNNYVFARHPDGFLIFLSPEEINALEEYQQGDPFGIEDKLKGDFHKGRIKDTISLISMLIKDKSTDIKLLDIGCGQGHITAAIKRKFPQFEISGLDCSLNAITKANSLYKDIDFILGTANKPPYAENYFDIIVCNNTWEHLKDPVFMLGNIKKAIKRNGHIIISSPSRYRIINLIKASLGKKVSISPNHITEYTVGQVIEQLKFSGFSIEKIISSPVKRQGSNLLVRIIVYKILQPILSIILKLMNSHHVLNSTAFYLAKKVSD